MTSQTIRRRLRNNGDVDGKKHQRLIDTDLDDLTEPLLARDDEYKAKELEVRNSVIKLWNFLPFNLVILIS